MANQMKANWKECTVVLFVPNVFDPMGVRLKDTFSGHTFLTNV